ncbi:hypothetical protein GFS60_00770 [Rhodococcus sp. WAY2]|nr:hypothetical protein GFS60_00770 [Rhodococcus sp. WAY2]
MVEHPGFFLSQDNNAPCAIGEPLEHRSPSHFPTSSHETGCLVPVRRVSLRHNKQIAAACSNASALNWRLSLEPTKVPRPHLIL